MTTLLTKIAGARIAKGNNPNHSTPHAIIPAQAPEAITHTTLYSIIWGQDFPKGGCPEENHPKCPHNTYGRYPKIKLPNNPKTLAGPKVPKQSPMTLPIPAPQAAAGPNNSDATMGIAFAGRNSTKPGTIGMPALKGIRIAA